MPFLIRLAIAFLSIAGLFFEPKVVFAQPNTTYPTAQFLCNVSSGSYTLNTSNLYYNIPGLDSGCLNSTKNPHWFRFQITSPGDIRWQMTPTSNANLDVIVYGPFNDPNPGLSAFVPANRAFCSNDPILLDNIVLNNVAAQQFYLMMVVSQEGNPGTFSFIPQAGNTASIGTAIRFCFANPTTITSCTPSFQLCTWPAISDISNVTFSGPGVNPTTGLFSPSLAGVGTHTITVLGNPYGCGSTQSANYTINVVACPCVPGISNPSGQTVLCHNSFVPPLEVIPCPASQLPPGVTVTSYQWQQLFPSSTVWQDIPGAVVSTLNSLRLTLSGQNCVRVLAIRSDGVEMPSNPTCFNVLPAIQVPNISISGGGSNTVCFNTNVTLLASAAIGGGNNFVYQWERSIDGGITWSDIVGATNLAYTTTATNSSLFRVEATDISLNNCGAVYSSTPNFSLIVLPQVNPGVISANPGGSLTPVVTDACWQSPVLITSVTGASGTGTVAYQWETSADGIVWNPIPGATTTTYNSPSPTTATTLFFRRTSTFTSNGITCPNPPASSNVVTISWIDDQPFVSLQRTLGFENQLAHNWIATPSTSGTISNITTTTVTMTTAPASVGSSAFVSYSLGAGIIPSDGIVTFRLRTGWLVSGSPNYSAITPTGLSGLVQSFEINGTPINLSANLLYSIRVRAGEAIAFRNGFVNVSGTGSITRRDTVVDFSFYPRNLNNQVNLCAGTSFTVPASGSNSAAVATLAPNFTAGDVTFSWNHNGNGNLLLPSSLTPTYNPGPADQGTNVTLTLTATRMSGVCVGRQSVVTYTITYRPTFVRSNVITSGPNPTLCINSIPTPLIASPASGGTGPYQYQWQSQVVGGAWINAAGVGANTLSFTPAPLQVSTTFRILTTDLGNPSCASSLVSTNTKTINVYQALVAPEFTVPFVNQCPGTTVCLNASQSSGGYNNFRYTFQVSSTPTGPWDNIPGLELISNPNGCIGNIWVNHDKYYRIIVQDFTSPTFTTFGCGTAWSNPIRVRAFDQTPPVISVTNPVIQVNSACLASITPAQVLSYVTFIDNCHPNAIPLLNPTITPSSFSAPGTYPAVISVMDSSGNVATATCIVTVQDLLPPTVITKSHTLYLNASGTAVLLPANVDNGSFDNCVATSLLTYTVTPNTFNCSNRGLNICTLTVSDGLNSASATCNVTVVDNLAPIISGLPTGTVSIPGYGNSCSANYSWNASATDNCGVPTLTSVPAYDPCRIYTAGNPVTYTYTATDGSGNITTQSFTISVQNANCPSVATRTAVTLDIPATDTCMENIITVGVNLRNYAGNILSNRLGAFSLVIDYDGSRLTPTSGTPYLANLISSIPLADLSYSLQAPSSIRIAWSGSSGIDICNKDTKLFDLRFNTSCNSGNASVSFNNQFTGNNELALTNATVIPNVQFVGASTDLKLCKGVRGKVSYANTAGTALSGVTLSIGGNSASTNSFGNFSVCGNNLTLGQSYPLTYSSSVSPPWLGANATDAANVRCHVLGSCATLTGINYLAADVNSDGSVNVTDALSIQRRFAGLSNSFPAGDWVYSVPNILFNTAVVTRNIQALNTGDVNGSRDFFAPRFNFTPLTVQGAVTPNNQIYSVPLYCDFNAAVGAISLVINIPEGIEVSDVLMPNSFSDPVVWKQHGNVLRLAWSSLNSVNLKEGDVVLTLNCRGIASGTLELGYETEFATSSGEVLSGLTLSAPRIGLIKGNSSSAFMVYPNPSKGLFNVGGDFTTLEVVDMFGRVVFNSTQPIKEIDLTSFSVGIYTLNVRTSNGIESHRLVLNR